MKLCILLFCVCWLCSCGQARIENAKSLANAKEAANYLLQTQLDEGQRRAASAIAIAIDPALDYLSRGFFGDKEVVVAPVSLADWKQSPASAEKGVIFQAARASAANRSWLSGLATWTNAIYAGITLIFGTAVTATVKKLLNQKGALTAALEYGRDALKVDPSDAVAVKALKKNAIAKKKGTSHEKELDRALIKMEPDTG